MGLCGCSAKQDSWDEMKHRDNPINAAPMTRRSICAEDVIKGITMFGLMRFACIWEEKRPMH